MPILEGFKLLFRLIRFSDFSDFKKAVRELARRFDHTLIYEKGSLKDGTVAALNALELGALTTDPSEDGRIRIDLEVAQECIQRKHVNYDKNGDNHYDVISAFIKSMRGSDPDAAVYYLARMLDAGEDPKFIARRIIICASEDVGNADPYALMLAVSASEGVERIGMPEGRILLARSTAC